MKRRTFLQHSAALAALGGVDPLLASTDTSDLPKGRAQACILLWLGGGPAQVDTFDPKPLGDPATRKAGSAYPAIDTVVPGVQVCEHLPELAKRMDRATVLRTMTHDVIDEHAAAVNFMHTGRPVSGTTVYPSIGSVVSHELGAGREGVPAYVVASDATLRAIVERSPASRAELARVKGIGPAKLERYGDDILALVAGAAPPADREGGPAPPADDALPGLGP